MWPFVLVLLINFYVGEGVPEIKIFLRKYDNGSMNCPSDQVVSPKLTLHKPFRLFVYSNVTIYNGTCYSSNTKIFHFYNFREENGYYVPYEELKLSKRWSNPITCELCTHSPEACKKIIEGRFKPETECNFTIDARESDLGYLSVNGIRVNTSTALETDNFDNYAVYSAFEGEPAMITCHIMSELLSLQLLYTNVYGTISTNIPLKHYKEFSKMYIKVLDNESYIDCVLKTYDNMRSLVTRINFKLNGTSPTLGFQVNGLTLKPVNSSQCKQEFCYQYQYYDGELLTIQSLKDERTYGDIINCVTEAENKLSLPKELNFTQERQPSFNVKAILKEKYKKITLICNVELKSYSSHLSNYETTVSLQLVPNTAADYSPIINGLSMANVLVMYKDHTLNVIYYEYHRELQLECHSETSGVKWSYTDSEIYYKEEKVEGEKKYVFEDSLNYFRLTGVFKLKPDRDSSVIQCISPESMQRDKKKLEEITKILIRRTKKDSENGFIENDVKNREISSTLTGGSTTEKPGQHTDGFSINKNILIGACFGTLALVIIVIFFIIRLTKQKPVMPDQNPTDINYVNLTEHNVRRNPATNQREDVYVAPTDCVPESDYAQPYIKTVEEMYSKPIPKDQRGHVNSTYATVGEVTYAQPLPVRKRTGQGVQVLPSGDLTYVELKHKTKILKNESPYAEVSKTENPYASVRNSESPYAEPDCGIPAENYANICESQRYVNVSSKDDFAEPAYCEIGKIKK